MNWQKDLKMSVPGQGNVRQRVSTTFLLHRHFERINWQYRSTQRNTRSIEKSQKLHANLLDLS